MDEQQKELMITTAKQNANLCEFIGKEILNLNRRLKKTNIDVNQDMFMSNIVESNFILSGVSLAQKSFSKMIAEKEQNADCEKKLHEYFLDEINSIYKVNDIKLEDSEEVTSDN